MSTVATVIFILMSFLSHCVKTNNGSLWKNNSDNEEKRCRKQKEWGWQSRTYLIFKTIYQSTESLITVVGCSQHSFVYVFLEAWTMYSCTIPKKAVERWGSSWNNHWSWPLLIKRRQYIILVWTKFHADSRQGSTNTVSPKGRWLLDFFCSLTWPCKDFSRWPLTVYF